MVIVLWYCLLFVMDVEDVMLCCLGRTVIPLAYFNCWRKPVYTWLSYLWVQSKQLVLVAYTGVWFGVSCFGSEKSELGMSSLRTCSLCGLEVSHGAWPCGEVGDRPMGSPSVKGKEENKYCKRKKNLMLSIHV